MDWANPAQEAEGPTSVARAHIAQTFIPAFTYNVDPPVPNIDLPSMPSVSKWRGRWNRAGFAGLEDASGRGRKPSVSAQAVGKALSLAATSTAHGGAWSVREMAAHTGLSKSSVQRL